MNTNIRQFIEETIEKPNNTPINILQFENAVLKRQKPFLSTSISEFSLQAYLYIHITEYFPMADRLLLYEQPIYKHRTDIGKVDFIYSTKNQGLLLIETKIINYSVTGRTAHNARRIKRNKVQEQVVTIRNTIQKLWDIPQKLIICGIFTTDPLLQPRSSSNIIAKYVTRTVLKNWINSLNAISSQNMASNS